MELKRLSNRTRFILAVVAGALKISGRKKAEIEAQLETEGYDRMVAARRKAHPEPSLSVIKTIAAVISPHWSLFVLNLEGNCPGLNHLN